MKITEAKQLINAVIRTHYKPINHQLAISVGDLFGSYKIIVDLTYNIKYDYFAIIPPNHDISNDLEPTRIIDDEFRITKDIKELFSRDKIMIIKICSLYQSELDSKLIIPINKEITQESVINTMKKWKDL